MKKKLIRTAAIPESLMGLLTGQLRFLNQYYEVVGVASNGKALQHVEEKEGIRTVAVNIERDINPFKDMVSLYKLYRLFKKEKPFMVHSITPKAGLLSMVAAYYAKVPRRIHTFTGLIFPTRSGFMKWLLLLFDKLICFHSTHIFPEGNGVKNDLLNFKVTKKPLKVIGHGNIKGVDLKYFDPSIFDQEKIQGMRRNNRVSTTDFVFVFIGRLVNDKGINELVNSFENLAESQTNVKLLLVGPLKGESDVIPDNILHKIENHKDIIHVGPQKDVRPFLAMSDALVFPSYREGFPNVVLEAGAMGLPSIVTDINGCNEIITEGQNGVIIPSRDEAALHKNMKTFVTDRNLVNTLAANARQMIASRFERNFVWKAVLEEYKLIVS
ncbi:glycosyltransferase family 4 protein [Maribacter sp. HTCC2170]|uniref:glycosyltransferase family 4 protein n=1 Tax=Maribacter sp. (strain HTCC2170 / KCCM 42371) TaxID=313603 RepID=UPI0005A2B103|nr:glycosyltransferase family 4 protein [Maribacter sp. HTCC2170]